jgi:CRP/FNR family transcriptional regulator, anaerobic regulatory protein
MDRLLKLKKSIEPIVSLSDDEFSTFIDVFECVKLGKNEFFLKEGQICDFIGFVNHGAMIYFKTNKNCDEITTDFAFEGDWVNHNLSRLKNIPSKINIKAIENTEILVIKQKDLETIYLKVSKIERLGRILMEHAYIKISEQSIDLQMNSAKDRYENLIKKYPHIVQRVQLYHIANYLGIAPKSLSRIRKEIFG